VKNYGRAICNFIISKTALPYLEDIYKKCKYEGSLDNFVKYVNDRKEKLDSIDRLKTMLLVNGEDSEQISQFKKNI